MGNIILHDKEFRPFIEATKIDQVITRMAEQMNRELADTQPLFLSILNGSFMFTSDLIKQIVIRVHKSALSKSLPIAEPVLPEQSKSWSG